MTSIKTRSLLGATLLLLTGCTGSSDGAGATPRAGGPLKAPPEQSYIVPAAEGEQFTDGFQVLFLEGDEPATILSVRSVGGQDALKFLGAKIAGPERNMAAVQVSPRFPPKAASFGPLVDAKGATIEPRAETRDQIGYELLLGYQVLDDSKLDMRTEVEVTYKVGGNTYLWTAPAALVVCPSDRNDTTCLDAADDAAG